MDSSIERLTRLVNPPERSTFSLEAIRKYEEHWDISFPSDYISFVRTYGTGSFFQEFGILAPMLSRHGIIESHLIQVAPYGYMYKRAYALEHGIKYPELVEFSFYPDAQGLLRFGVTAHDVEVFWKQTGAPDTWKILLSSDGFNIIEEYDFGMTEFIARWLEGTLGSAELWDIVLCSENSGIPIRPDRMWVLDQENPQ